MSEPKDTTFDITADLLESTPIEKCSLNPRRGKNSKRLLTGFIIYASEVRKLVADQHPDENFGFISRLVGDKWRALSKELRFKYHQRALIHNRRIKEQAQRDGITLGGTPHKGPRLAGRPHKGTPHTGTPHKDATHRDTTHNDATYKDTTNKDAPPKDNLQKGTLHTGVPLTNGSSTKLSEKRLETNRVDSSTQTPAIRYVEPPPRKPLMYSDAFLKRLQAISERKRVTIPTS